MKKIKNIKKFILKSLLRIRTNKEGIINENLKSLVLKKP